MIEARITGLTIETEHLTAKVVVDENNERAYIIGWKSGTVMMRFTQDDLDKIGAEYSKIDILAGTALYNQQSVIDKKKIEEMDRVVKEWINK